jgi:hypothetical protein
MKSLQVGDLCVTQNAKCAAVNNGLLVVVLEINLARTDDCPYLIRRVDGQAFPHIINADGPVWFKETECWAARHKLRRVDPDGTVDAVVRETDLEIDHV